MLARNDVIGKLAGLNSPCSLNEPYSSYLKKKELVRQIFERYSSQCSYLTQMIQHF